jgi:hypothetical protein
MDHRSVLVAAGLVLAVAGVAFGHPGGLDSRGGHHDRKRGGYHYHGGRPSRPVAPAPTMTRPVARTGGALGIADLSRGDNYRTRGRTTARQRVQQRPATPPPDVRPLIEEIEFLLDGDESADDRSAAASRLDEIATAYEGTPEAAEALRLLREIRAEEEQERREKFGAELRDLERREQEAERVKRENAASSKLLLAKRFLDSGKTSHARKWLEDVIRTFPDTSAAREASGLLSKLAIPASN